MDVEFVSGKRVIAAGNVTGPLPGNVQRVRRVRDGGTLCDGA
jgi:hypothetical protein